MDGDFFTIGERITHCFLWKNLQAGCEVWEEIWIGQTIFREMVITWRKAGLNLTRYNNTWQNCWQGEMRIPTQPNYTIPNESMQCDSPSSRHVSNHQKYLSVSFLNLLLPSMILITFTVSNISDYRIRHNNIVLVVHDLAMVISAGFISMKEQNSHVRPESIAKLSASIQYSWSCRSSTTQTRFELYMIIDDAITRPTRATNMKSHTSEYVMLHSIWLSNQQRRNIQSMMR